jgi:predicted small integral membrane protein
MIRLIKTVITLFLGLFCLMYALQNIFNLQAGYGFIALMTSMEGHVGYPNSFGPPVTAPALVWTIFWIIILTELAAGSAAIKGFMDMWSARNADAATFNAAKQWGIVGAGLGIIIWFGYFHAIGGAYFQMWQVEAGRGPFQDSALFVVMCGVIALILMQADD